MKFLANENFPFPSIEVIRNLGYEVISIAEKYSGISDLEVIKLATEQRLIILTFDKDYGEIIFKLKQIEPPAVVFYRFKGITPPQAGLMLKELISSSIQLNGMFTVIEEENIRQRKYS
jgi:predicted nuclease of predicted toxin-antitoxin system